MLDEASICPRITDLRNGGRYMYVSAKGLFWVIRELQASKKD